MGQQQLSRSKCVQSHYECRNNRPIGVVFAINNNKRYALRTQSNTSFPQLGANSPIGRGVSQRLTERVRPPHRRSVSAADERGFEKPILTTRLIKQWLRIIRIVLFSHQSLNSAADSFPARGSLEPRKVFFIKINRNQFTSFPLRGEWLLRVKRVKDERG